MSGDIAFQTFNTLLVKKELLFALTVPTPPALTQSLPVSTIYFSPNSGETLTLPCVATGQPKPESVSLISLFELLLYEIAVSV